MEPQSIDSQRGEVEFRKKLSVQHVTGETLLDDYYSKDEHDEILHERMETTAANMRALKPGITLSPFIELGAERCQRSLVLTNDFNAEGFACDISFHQLRTATHFAERFKKPRLPHRVCCDINNLPFRDNAVPFMFCYEFLHHFPSPKPILEQAHRVLGNGVFFFNEEPFRRPKLVLFHQTQKQYAKATLSKSKTRRFLESFFTEEYCDEREHGIIENDDIPLSHWNESLAVFTSREITAYSLGNRLCTRLDRGVSLKNLPNVLLGGGIRGLCRKKVEPWKQPANLREVLACPDCRHSPLEDQKTRLVCSACRTEFPVVDDISILLPTRLRRELYPEFSS
jgi:uncharacterized protein YbaR (Trm112 family)/ubiquinone/menaquinone biosynthesis C-methylase UbiE